MRVRRMGRCLVFWLLRLPPTCLAGRRGRHHRAPNCCHRRWILCDVRFGNWCGCDCSPPLPYRALGHSRSPVRILDQAIAVHVRSLGTDGPCRCTPPWKKLSVLSPKSAALSCPCCVDVFTLPLLLNRLFVPVPVFPVKPPRPELPPLVTTICAGASETNVEAIKREAETVRKRGFLRIDCLQIEAWVAGLAQSIMTSECIIRHACA